MLYITQYKPFDNIDKEKIKNELPELGGSIEGVQRKIQQLLKAFEIPESNLRKRKNFKNCLDTSKFKKIYKKRD